MRLQHVTAAICIAACGLMISSVAHSEQVGFSRCVQVSDLDGHKGKCEKAMDGNVNQDWRANSMTHTEVENNLKKPWWTGFFDDQVTIRSVKIYNRQDCCSDRLSHFYILVDGRVCAYYNGQPFSVKEFPCSAVGSSVTILSVKINSKFFKGVAVSRWRAPLSLAEVQVFGTERSLGSQVKFSRCEQSSNLNPSQGLCDLAMDDNLDPKWRGKSVSHTASGGLNWWTGHFNRRVTVTYVRLYNRMDCCSDRLGDFSISVDGVACATYSGHWFAVRTFSCNKSGQSVTVQSNKRNQALSLAEVQVFGE